MLGVDASSDADLDRAFDARDSDGDRAITRKEWRDFVGAATAAAGSGGGTTAEPDANSELAAMAERLVGLFGQSEKEVSDLYSYGPYSYGLN